MAESETESETATIETGSRLPRERLDRRAITLWRINAAGEGAFLLLIGGAATATMIWQDVTWWLAPLPAVVALALATANVLWVPGLLWRHWRYEIRELEVDLQHGIWTVTRTLIPMARIQHVDTRRGPVQQRLGLASVVLFTAAGSSEVPALAVEVADDVRDRIAALASVREEV